MPSLRRPTARTVGFHSKRLSLSSRRRRLTAWPLKQQRRPAEQRRKQRMTIAETLLDKYRKTAYDPDREYLDGELEERNVGDFDHRVTSYRVWHRFNYENAV